MASALPFQPVLLLTDRLAWLLVVVVTTLLLWARRQPHLRASAAQIGSRPVPVAALVVLLCYVVVGLADSLHFHPAVTAPDDDAPRYSAEVLSVLDLVLEPLRENTEKTYSAPLALHAHSKETLTGPDGTEYRDYPRLEHGGAHLESADQHVRDVAMRSLGGALAGIGATAVAVLAWLWLHRPLRPQQAPARLLRLLRGHSPYAARSALLTLAAVGAVIGALWALAPNYHVLGTDKVGLDVLYLSLKSIRTGLLIGSLTLAVMIPLALLFGIAAGYFGGWIDDAIQYVYTTLTSIPGVLLIAAAVLSLDLWMETRGAGAFSTLSERADLRLLALCLILGATGWVGLCRLLRGEALKLRELEYVQASICSGLGHARILSRHLLPNVMHIVLITAVIDFSGLVLAEAVLSYVGIGVDPAMISWGNMINAARLELARDPVVWWSLLAAFVFMFGLVLAANLFADAVRDALDPRLRGS